MQGEKRRSSTLKGTTFSQEAPSSCIKKGDGDTERKPKRVSFAPDELVLHFATDPVSSGDQESFLESKPSGIDMDILVRSPLLLHKSKETQLNKENVQEKDATAVLEKSFQTGGKRTLVSHHKDRKKADSSIAASAKANPPLLPRRSPRIQSKKKIASASLQSKIDSLNFDIPETAEERQQCVEPVFAENKADLLIDLNDITAFATSQPTTTDPIVRNVTEEVHKSGPEEPQCSVQMEISSEETADGPPSQKWDSATKRVEGEPEEIFGSLNMEISQQVTNNVHEPSVLNQMLSGDNKSVAMETSVTHSVNISNMEYSLSLVQKYKEKQERVTSLAEELRSVLSISTNECNNSTPYIGKVQPPSRVQRKSIIAESGNQIKLLKIYEDLQSILKLLKERPKCHQRANQCENVGPCWQESLGALETAKTCYKSKFFEFDSFREECKRKHSELVRLFHAKMECIKKTNPPSVLQTTFKNLQRLLTKHSILPVELSPSVYRIFLLSGYLSYTLTMDTDFNLLQVVPQFHFPSGDEFGRLFHHLLTEADMITPDELTIKTLLVRCKLISRICDQLRLTCVQLESASRHTGLIKYSPGRLGVYLFIGSRSSYLVWFKLKCTSNGGLQVQLESTEHLAGLNITDELTRSLGSYVSENDFQVLPFITHIFELVRSKDLYQECDV